MPASILWLLVRGTHQDKSCLEAYFWLALAFTGLFLIVRIRLKRKFGTLSLRIPSLFPKTNEPSALIGYTRISAALALYDPPP